MASEFAPFIYKDLKPSPIIGVDEVGRGCLAGPVFAAACVVPSGVKLDGVTDSKLLSEKRRKYLSEKIYAECKCGIGFATVEEISELNILWAAMLAMKRAVEELQLSVGHILVDGNRSIPKMGTGFKQTTVVKGDLRCLPIGAASIIAKVRRDELMQELGDIFPQYGFAKHKGYGSKLHRDAIQKYGPSSHHRKDFSGVKEFWKDLPQLR